MKEIKSKHDTREKIKCLVSAKLCYEKYSKSPNFIFVRMKCSLINYLIQVREFLPVSRRVCEIEIFPSLL